MRLPAIAMLALCLFLAGFNFCQWLFRGEMDRLQQTLHRLEKGVCE